MKIVMLSMLKVIVTAIMLNIDKNMDMLSMLDDLIVIIVVNLDIDLDTVSKLMVKIVKQVVNLDIVSRLMVLQTILMIKIQDYIGNYELLKLSKTAFLCSRKVPASVVLKCYDWAIEQRGKGNCVISGFHSKLEKDVLHFLIKGDQPIIVVLARGLKQKVEHELEGALSQNRLLIVSPFDKQKIRVTKETSQTRNRLMIDLADNITVGFIGKGGLLEDLLRQVNKKIIQI